MPPAASVDVPPPAADDHPAVHYTGPAHQRAFVRQHQLQEVGVGHVGALGQRQAFRQGVQATAELDLAQYG
ncbi:MAG: hypothetical protein ABSE77_23425, partial [Acidimicrobiales bacterium]